MLNEGARPEIGALVWQVRAGGHSLTLTVRANDLDYAVQVA